MVQANPPLFVQDGEYPARLDRNLIGALIQPVGEGSNPLIPRPGVRAHFVDSAGEETSLRVKVSGNRVAIEPGVAFVSGQLVDGLAAIYQVTNPATQFLDVDAVIPGSTQQGVVGIQITDPGDAPVVGAAEGKWEFVYLSTTMGQSLANFLWLAGVTIPDATSKPLVVTDARVYTTGLGGTLRVANKDILLRGLSGYPIGSQAYSVADDLTYIRTKGGWAQHPAVALYEDIALSNPPGGHNGELCWNVKNQILSVWQVDSWIDVARPPAAAKLATGTSWPKGPNEMEINPPDMKINMTKANTWMSIGHQDVHTWGQVQNELKAEENSLIIQVYSYSTRSLVVAYVHATVHAFIKDANGAFIPDTTNTFFLNLDAFASSSMTFSDIGKPSGYVPQYAMSDPDGESWTDRPERRDFYRWMSNLDQGVTSLRPIFKAAKPGYFEIKDLHIQVNTT